MTKKNKFIENLTTVTLTDDVNFDKNPSIAKGVDERLWVVWNSYNGKAEKEDICYRYNEKNIWFSEQKLLFNSDINFKPFIVAGKKEEIWIFCCSKRDNYVGIYARLYNGKNWKREILISQNYGFNNNPVSVTDNSGNIWVFWENYHRKKSGIFGRKIKQGGILSKIIEIEKGNFGCFRPRCCMINDNCIVVTWDGFKNGNYQIYLRLIKEDRFSDIFCLTEGFMMNSWSAIDIDNKKNLWIAWVSYDYDVLWYLNTGVLNIDYIEKGYLKNKVLAPEVIDSTPPRMNVDMVSIKVDENNRPWVFYRIGSVHNWRFAVKYRSDQGWSEPYIISEETKIEVGPSPLIKNGKFCLVWSCADKRDCSGKEMKKNKRYNIKLTSLKPGLNLPKLGVTKTDVKEKYNFKFSYTMNRRKISLPILGKSGSKYKMYFGDIHGQTRISDGLGEIDQYYFRAKYINKWDISALTDHDYVHGIIIHPSDWLLIQTMTDFYNEPLKEFLTLHGYEWTGDWPNAVTNREFKGSFGHKNVYYVEYGHKIHRIIEKDSNTCNKLFKRVRKEKGLVFPHHTAVTWGQVPWEFHDDSVQTCAEIISMHGTSESKDNTEIKTYSGLPGHYIQDALKKGLKLGFIGGSDGHGMYGYDKHGIWKTGITVFLVKNLSRLDIFEALRNRRCYATTGARIILEFSINGHIIGEEFILNENKIRHITIKVKGTDRIVRVEIIKNEKVIFKENYSKYSVNIEFEDKIKERSTDYYYVRLRQIDGEIAWSSPIWISVQGRVK